MLVADWEETPVSDAQGLRCELFERDVDPPDERWWGHSQNVRPSIQVADLPANQAALADRGVRFTGDREVSDLRQSVEFAAPDDVRWSLAYAPDYPAGENVRSPRLGWVDLGAANLQRQREFYTEVMGLSVGDRATGRVRLEQSGDDPLLFLESGGERVRTDEAYDSPFDVQPVWLSFETTDVAETAAWLSAHDVTVIEDVTTHDWGGTDLTNEDPDGNPVQVVEYHDE